MSPVTAGSITRRIVWHYMAEIHVYASQACLLGAFGRQAWDEYPSGTLCANFTGNSGIMQGRIKCKQYLLQSSVVLPKYQQYTAKTNFG